MMMAVILHILKDKCKPLPFLCNYW